MDTSQAKELIRNLFTNPFGRQRYEHFLRNLLNRFEPRSRHYTGNYIPDAFKPHVNQYWRIGKYVDPDGEPLDLLVVEVKTLAKLERARSALRNFAVNRLKQFEKEASLIAFYARDDEGADWRFSFVKIEHEAYKDDKGKVRLKQELTPARRYSYLVGVHENSHTAARQLLPILTMDYADPRIDQIEAAFSVEKVSDEFFEQYKQLFLKLASHLKNQNFFQCKTEPETDQAVSRFAKKLLGQIVFLYFLQKKGWLGVPKEKNWGEGSRRFLRERFDQIVQSSGNYFHDFLQYLFYEALALERQGKNPNYYSRFDCKIPFLNGGLFEAEYDWQNESIDLPNNLFHNNEKNKAGDTGTGILDVFDRYNFTIKEDEPLEKEVAIDPEMLGKVFENMLEITERKSKGAFYTPRQIVHYMCQESLIHYLDSRLNSYPTSYQKIDSPLTSPFGNEGRKNQPKRTAEHQDIKVPKEDIETLIRKGHLALENDTRVLNRGKETREYKFQLPEAVRKYAKEIDQALAEIKVCDPAIGSGAFPVGLLHEIVAARLALAPHSDNPRSAYELKRHAIRESIYGVDIDPSAIDIARLRLWLSMIVDEERYDTIEPLPNLDYKIVCGDSLLGIEVDLCNRLLFNELEKKKKAYFNATNRNDKKQLHEEIETLITRITNGRKNFDFKVFFSEIWHEKGGFDVVIGNPPYVQIQKFSGQQVQKDWEAQKYKTFAKTGDIYCLFYEKGHQILRERGVLAFITSNKWMRAAYGKKLRKFLLERVAILELIDFGDSPIFSEATTYTNILIFEKRRRQQEPRAWDLTNAYQKAASLLRMLEENPPGAPLFTADGFVITAPEMAAIKKRIEEVGTPLREWDIAINYGIKTGYNQAFIIDGRKRAELIGADPKSAEIIKPILRGRDIKRYRVDFADLWLINTHNGHGRVPPVDVNDYPTVKAHLDQYRDKLEKRQDKGVTPYNLRNCAYLEEFAKEKIVYAEIVFDSAFYYDESGAYPEATAFVLTGKNTKYLTALLNSQLLTFAFRAFYAGGDLRGETFRYKKVFILSLPVINPENIQNVFFETLVDYVQHAKRNAQTLQSAFFEQLIDALVYELYFPDDLQVAGKDVLRHLGELAPITDEMSEEAKLAVIQRQFDRLYDPSHPVRNIIETLDSVQVVRTIREALQR
jgi:type I restriction-modification system DNA methylase subunit